MGKDASGSHLSVYRGYSCFCVKEWPWWYSGDHMRFGARSSVACKASALTDGLSLNTYIFFIKTTLRLSLLCPATASKREYHNLEKFYMFMLRTEFL